MFHIKPPCFIKSPQLCILRFPSTNDFRLVTIYCGSCCIAQTETVLAAFSNEQTSEVDMQFRLVAFWTSQHVLNIESLLEVQNKWRKFKKLV